MAFSPDGRYALTASGGSGGDDARLWNVETGKTVRTLKKTRDEPDFTHSAAFSPDGRYVLTSASNPAERQFDITLWDVASGEKVQVFQGHSNTVNSVAFSPDGRYVLTGSDDLTIRLWDAKTGQELRAFGDGSRITGVAFSPDGRYILSGNADGARLWEMDYRALIDYACRQVFRDFTEQERTQFRIFDDEPTCPQFGDEAHPFRTPFPTSEPVATATIPLWTPVATPTVSPTATTAPPPRPAQLGENRGKIVRGGYEIWLYKGQAGETITVTVLADNPGNGTNPNRWAAEGKFDPKLGIFDPGEKLLAENDDINSTRTASGGAIDTNSQIVVTLPADGTYLFVVISSYDGLTSGAYTLVVKSSLTVSPTPTP